MIASLPMYLRAETRPALDALWSLTRAALSDLVPNPQILPETLSHDAPVRETWARPDLLLGQICNLPYNSGARAHLHRLGACNFALPGAEPGFYHSHFVVRRDDPRATPAAFAQARLAINEGHSHSGWGAPWGYARDNGFAWTNVQETGAHTVSAAAVAAGRADIAAIDAVSWRLIERYDACAGDLRIIARTAASPGQTLVTARAHDPAPIQHALRQALRALPADHADTLMLRDIIALPDAAYAAVTLPDPPPQATVAR